jgi:hypothetical protein
MSRINIPLNNGRTLVIGLDHAPQGYFFQLEAKEDEPAEIVSEDGYVKINGQVLDGMNAFTAGLTKGHMIENMSIVNLWMSVPESYRSMITLDLDPGDAEAVLV